MESDKEGNNKVSSKPSSAVLPHKKTKKSSILAADPAGMQNYSALKEDKGYRFAELLGATLLHVYYGYITSGKYNLERI